ncbi:MAG: T9SS type A sorting domain-containing protein [Bacteroidota bacterium]
MRYLYLVVICFFLSRAGEAQYIPTAVEGANWVMLDSDLEFSQGYYAFLRTISGDTIINQKAYKKLYEHRLVYWPEEGVPPLAAPYEVLPERRLIGMLRDDTTAQRVYGIMRIGRREGAADFTPDTLLQEYSLEMGDTLKGWGFDTGGGALVVTEVLYEYHFGRQRKVLKSWDGPYYEGIGSLFYGPSSGGSSYITNSETHVLVDYCLGDFGECRLWLTPVAELTQDIKIIISPNPFAHFINLETKRPFSKTITTRLLNTLGETISTTKLTGQATISTENLPAGIYFLEFRQGSKRTLKKVIKQ